MNDFKSIYKKSISLVFILFCFKAAIAQTNLVPNPSFEAYTNCNSTTLPIPWKGLGFEGYLNSCTSDPCCSVPINGSGLGFQYAHIGNAYVGGFLYLVGYNNRRDYVQVKLLDTLKADYSYYVEFFVNLTNYSKYAISNVGLLFSDTAVKVNLAMNPNGLIPANPQIILPNYAIIFDTLNWIKVSGIYKAKGGEQYITIGNFKDDANTNIVTFNTTTGFNGAGYYIDDITVTDSLILPINFLSFSLRLNNSKIENIWTTTNETNVSHFNIQRSTNGKDFTTIGKLAAQNKITNEYHYTDNCQQSTVDGGLSTIYYRIESIDFDGRKQYSTIQQINIQHPTSNIVIFPNPAKEVVSIDSKGIQQIKIINELGQTLMQINNPTEHQTINTKQFIKGLYIVKATKTTGETTTQKLIIQ